MEQYPPPFLAGQIPAVILAGGQSNRLRINNKLKWQLPFADTGKIPNVNQTLLSFIVKRLALQTNHIVINGSFVKNTALDQYKLPIIDDSLPNFQGPLSGILTALSWAKSNHHPWVATVSCDSPFFPRHLLSTLSNNLDGKQAAIAKYESRTHPTFGLWSTTLYTPLKNAIEAEHIRAVNRWALQYSNIVEFKNQYDKSTDSNKPIDPFFNINTFDDYQQALGYLAAIKLEPRN